MSDFIKDLVEGHRAALIKHWNRTRPKPYGVPLNQETVSMTLDQLRVNHLGFARWIGCEENWN